MRLQNHAEHDPEKDLPWSSKSLRECYRVDAERFGWSRRTAEPRSMREGRTLVGWGMATATYHPANRQAARASASIWPMEQRSFAAVRTMRTGTYTVMAQVAADALGMPVLKVGFELGDTGLPEAPVSGGSQTVASVGPAVHASATAARDKLVAVAVGDSSSPPHGLRADDVGVDDGWIIARNSPGRREPMAAVITRNGGQAVNAENSEAPGDEKKQFSIHSFGAVFVEVHVGLALVIEVDAVPMAAPEWGAARFDQVGSMSTDAAGNGERPLQD